MRWRDLTFSFWVPLLLGAAFWVLSWILPKLLPMVPSWAVYAALVVGLLLIALAALVAVRAIAASSAGRGGKGGSSTDGMTQDVTGTRAKAAQVKGSGNTTTIS
jgi:hypothetical protein